MLNKIISFSIENKLIVGLLTIALILYGIYQTTLLPIDAVPDITDNQVQVITISPALGAPDVERLITFPIEQANNNIPGLKEIRSFSRFGLSLVTIVFDDNTDIYWARQQVNERLAQAKTMIPAGVGNPELAPVTTGLGEIYQYVVRPKEGYENSYSLTDLRTIQDWIIRRQLIGIAGVADVSSFGGKLKQYSVSVMQEKMNSLQISMKDVCTAIENNNNNSGGAYIERGPSVLFIRTEGLTKSIDDIKQITVKTLQNGVPILIQDIANVEYGSATRYGAMCYNDKGEVAGAVVMMLKGENSSDVVERVKVRIEEIQKTLPEGIVIESFLDRTKMVTHAIGTVEKNLVEGALIVVLILVLFLGNFRAGILVASVIPLSMLFAIIMMNLFGVSGNLMSLGALDFGLIIDGAVIIVEAAMHQLTHSKKFKAVTRIDQSQMDDEVKSSASRMMNAAVFGQVIILIVYLPILTLQGIEGKMFKPMAQTVAFALLGAFILSLTYVPMMSAFLLSKKIRHTPTLSDKLMFWLEKRYEKLLDKVLNHPKKIIGATILMFLISLVVLSSLGGEFIPELEEGDFAVDTRLLTGSSLSTTIETTQKSASLLLNNFQEVEKVVTKIGSGEIPTDPMPIEASDMMVILKPKDQWTNAKSFDELAEKMSKKLSEIPGITAGFQYPVQMRFNELMTGARQDVVCKIFGENIDTLARHAEVLGSIASSIEGAKDIYVESVSGMPQVVISYDRATIANYGLSIEEINLAISTAFAGKTTGQVYEDEKRFDIVVRLPETERKDVTQIRNLMVNTPSGLHLPLSTFAEIKVIDGPNQIQREDAKRRIVVGFNVRGRDVESLVNELRAEVSKKMKLPPGYNIVYSGSFENLNAAKSRLMIAVPVALLLILLMLYFAFKSIRQGLIIFSAIPFSAIGGILALVLRGMPFSISAGVGFIALFGVAVLNGIVLIAEFNRLIKEGWTDPRKIVHMGTKIRLRPVLMTAAVASLGFLPMAMSNGAGAEVQRPLATVVIGGLITATFLTLFVLPILFQLRKRQMIKGKTVVATSIILLCSFSNTEKCIAQSTNELTLENYLTTGMKKSQLTKSAAQETMYRETLAGIRLDLQKTNLGFEHGQFNTSLIDNKFSAQQNFLFPTYYGAQHNMYREQLEKAKSLQVLNNASLSFQISSLYYQWQVCQQQLRLMQNLLDQYQLLLQKFDLRKKTGDLDPSEFALTENLVIRTSQSISQLRIQSTILENQLNLISGVNYSSKPILGSFQVAPLIIQDSTTLLAHPFIEAQQHELLSDGFQLKMTKSQLLPEFMLGYNNTSIRGWETLNGSDRFHPPSDRFSWISVGLQLPIAYGAGNKKLKAANILQQKKSEEFEYLKQQFSNEFAATKSNYLRLYDEILLYEKTILVNSDQIISIAKKQYDAGEIDFIQWVNKTDQAVKSKLDYFTLIDSYNTAAIQYQYLLKSK
jgi:cobalt-zinc-cadmium resistance protein CzcA